MAEFDFVPRVLTQTAARNRIFFGPSGSILCNENTPNYFSRWKTFRPDKYFGLQYNLFVCNCGISIVFNSLISSSSFAILFFFKINGIYVHRAYSKEGKKEKRYRHRASFIASHQGIFNDFNFILNFFLLNFIPFHSTYVSLFTFLLSLTKWIHRILK